jgi:uncharacterized protein (DUF1015 family)
MANIEAFKAIRPNPVYADQLVLTKPQAESVAGNPEQTGALAPLKVLLETSARMRPETTEGQALAYEDINQTLQYLLTTNRLWQEEKPGIYIYEIARPGYRQTGVWALTALSDYTKRTIKIHELTFADSVRRIRNYRENTGLEGSPILLTYAPDIRINRIIAEVRKKGIKQTFGNREGFHRLWKIDDVLTQKKLIKAFANIKDVYLSDGHHRLESAASLAKEQRAQNKPFFNSISSLYMASDQLRIQEFDRVVVADTPISKEYFFKEIEKSFLIHQTAKKNPIQPRKPNQMGMFAFGEWYHLAPKVIPKSLLASLDATILQKQLLAPVFGITDPGIDNRLKCIGGEKAMEEISLMLTEHKEAFAFTLCPLTAAQLIAVSDAGETLPPKSTWIDPKIPYGLLIRKNEIG